MPAPLPIELRDRFASYIADGLSGREAARRMRISAATGGRWARQVRAQGVARKAKMGRPQGTGKLAPFQPFFEELIAQDPDITLFELRDALLMAQSVQVHHSAVAKLLSRLGFTYKKSRWSPPNGCAPASDTSGMNG